MTSPDRPSQSGDGSKATCEKPLTTGARCRRKARYQVNGHLACARHLQGSITHYAVANSTGHLWASVQILPAVPR